MTRDGLGQTSGAKSGDTGEDFRRRWVDDMQKRDDILRHGIEERGYLDA